MRVNIDVGVKYTDIDKIHKIESELDKAMENLGLYRFETMFTDYSTHFEYHKNIKDNKNELD